MRVHLCSRPFGWVESRHTGALLHRAVWLCGVQAVLVLCTWPCSSCCLSCNYALCGQTEAVASGRALLHVGAVKLWQAVYRGHMLWSTLQHLRVCWSGLVILT